MLTGLERLAMIGDRQAQDECTQRGIVLPCPFCGNEPITEDNRVFCGFCGIAYEELDAGLSLSAWNTRLAPPLHRCVECEKYLPIRNEEYGCSDLSGLKELMETGICNKFESKKGDTV